MGVRQCSLCGEWKELTDFYVRKESPDGYRRDCKACCAERNTKVVRDWRAKNRDKYLKQNRDSVERWRERYPERRKAVSDADYAKHRERYFSNNRLRRARKRDAETLEILDREIRRALSSPCAHCGCPSEELDHVIPLSRGGRHSVGNLQGLCKPCNTQKGNRLEIEVRLRRRRG